jgi:LTXXQ motif family protein
MRPSRRRKALKVSCTAYQMLTPTGRVEAMEKRLDVTLGAVKTVQPALAKFYNSLSDEQKARFNSLGSFQNLRTFGLAERRPALAHAVMAPLIC